SKQGCLGELVGNCLTMPSLSMSAIFKICSCTASYALTSPAQSPFKRATASCGEIEMVFHHRSHFGLRPALWICAAEKVGDLISIGEPAFVRISKFRLIIGFGGRNNVCCGGNVVFQKCC